MFFVIVILLVGFYFYKTGELQQWLGNIERNSGVGDNAKNILDIRLAKGEISAEEYQKLKSVL